MSGNGSGKVGFVVLSYHQPEHLLRLCQTLGRMYGEAPIVCNHDFDQCELDIRAFPSHVKFVTPHVRTAWASMSCVKAEIEALKVLYRWADPSWYVLLSGSDYPVAPAARVLKIFDDGEWDAFVDHRVIRRKDQTKASGVSHGFSADWWPGVAFRRYGPLRLKLPWRRVPIVLDRPHLDWLHPIRLRGWEIYGGCHWHMASRKCARAVVDGDIPVDWLMDVFRYAPIPEECFWQTAYCNQRNLRVCPNGRRFEDWSGLGNNPATLGESHLPRLVDSGALFARKWVAGDPALDRVDSELLGLQPAHRHRGG